MATDVALVWDYDGVIDLITIDHILEKPLPQVLRDKGRATKVTKNVLFDYADMMGIGRGVAESRQVAKKKELELDHDAMMSMSYGHENGAHLFVLTANKNIDIIKETLKKKGIEDVTVVYAPSATQKAEEIRRLMKDHANVIYFNDSFRDSVVFTAKFGFKNDVFKFVANGHNSTGREFVGLLTHVVDGNIKSYKAVIDSAFAHAPRIPVKV